MSAEWITGEFYPSTFCRNKNRILSDMSLYSKAYHPNSTDEVIQACNLNY